MTKDLATRRTACIFVGFLLGLVAIVDDQAVRADNYEGFKKLKAAQIRKAFVGKEYTDDVHFSNKFNADGSIDTFSLGRQSKDKWHIESDTLCLEEGGRIAKCYEVWKKGEAVSLRRPGIGLNFDGFVR